MHKDIDFFIYSPKRAAVIVMAAIMACFSVGLNALDLVPFSGSQQIDQSNNEGDYIVALGPMRNINSRWRAEDERLVQGNVDRFVYELPRAHDLSEIMQTYYSQLQRFEATPLFVCQGHNCGSSASWANEHFSERRLYGLDQFQDLAVFQVIQEQEVTLVTIYGVTRGNQRSYLLVDLVKIDSSNVIDQIPTVKTVESILKGRRYLPLPLNTADGKYVLTDGYGTVIAQFLKSSPSTNIALVVSDHREKRLDKNIASSVEVAEALEVQLQEAGIADNRIEIHGLGNLLPGKENAVAAWVMSVR